MHDITLMRPTPRSGPVVRIAAVVAYGLVALVVSGCSSGGSDSDGDADSASSPSAAEGPVGEGADDALYPDVVDVELTELGDGNYRVEATLSSPYDSPDRYADAWRVMDADGNELGVRELAHDHASEQPFTRSETIQIPDDVDEVTVEGRDQLSGYGGATATVKVPRDTE